MTQVGRNERCSCGSGKKFKHCCLAAQLQPSHEMLLSRRLGRLADWIAAKFRSQIPAQADEFFYEFDAEEREILNSGKHAGANGVATLVTDFICIDGVFELHGVKQTGLDWFQQVSGPLSPADAAFYDSLSISGLRAYRVLSIHPGRGMALLDLFEPELECGFVHEQLGSSQIAVGDVIGARLVLSDGVLQISAMVLFQPTDAEILVANYAEDWGFARVDAGFSDAIADENELAFDAAIAEIALQHRADSLLAGNQLSDKTEVGGDTESAADQASEPHREPDNDQFGVKKMRNIVDEITLKDMVAARVVITYWLESVLSSLGHERSERLADE